MSARSEAFARYLEEIYKDYDALLDNERLIREFHLSTREVQAEQIINLSENFDIEELVFLVLMQSSKEAEDELRDLLGDIQAATQAKRRLRNLITKLKKRIEADESQARDEYRQREDDESDFERFDFEMVMQALLVVAADQSNREVQSLADQLILTRKRIQRAGIDTPVDKAKQELDSMSELGEMESLRLQMAMDRRSKFIETLSNILKKMADTDAAIVQNLK